MSISAGRIGDGRVAAIEDADLHQLPRRTSSTNVTPTFSSAGRPAGNLSSSTHCLNVLAEHRPVVDDAELVAQDLPLAVAGRRRDAVDHAVGKGDVRAIQAASSGSTSSASPATASAATLPLWGMLSQDITVKGGVPAARRRISPARISPNTVFGASGLAASATMSGWLGSKCAGGGVDEVAALGDRQRDDADGRIGELRDDRRGVAGGRKSIIDAGDACADAPASCSTTVVSQSCAARRSRIRRLRARTPAPTIAQSRSRPGVEQIVEIDRLVGAVEVADAEMHDAGRRGRCRRAAIAPGTGKR